MKRLLGALFAIVLGASCSDPSPGSVDPGNRAAGGGTLVIGGLGDVLTWNP